MEELIPTRDFARTFEVVDCTVRSDGSGRIVEAVITPFDTPQEVKDQEGHYIETNGRSSFDKTLAERGLNYQVLFNHGRTFDGRPDGNLMIPIGVPREIYPTERGLYSATEYLDNPLADATLDAIKKGAIRGYSYTGRFIKSMRQSPATRGGLPSIHRSEIAMKEYGPVLYPAYSAASILGTRSTFLDELDPEDIERFRQMLGIATPLEPASPGGTTPVAATTVEDPANGQSDRQPIPSYLRLRKQAREKGVIRHDSTH